MRSKQIILAATGASLAALTFSAFIRKKEKPIPTIQNFQQEKYLGKWYEIACSDFKWKKKLTQVTADLIA